MMLDQSARLALNGDRQVSAQPAPVLRAETAAAGTAIDEKNRVEGICSSRRGMTTRAGVSSRLRAAAIRS